MASKSLESTGCSDSRDKRSLTSLLQAETAARICSSTSLALAGMGVPGP
jgi:hypothetical protein